MGKRRRSSIAQDVIETIRVPSGAINDAAVIDDELGEISAEFGDNISMSSRGAGRRVSLAPDDITESPPELPPDDDVPVKFTEYFHIISLMHLIPLIWKNFLWMWRNVPVMAFIVLLPVTQIVLFCYTIGHDPKGLALAVVNYEVNTRIIFFLTVALTSGAMLLERNEGSLERSLVIGITGVELLFSHVITQFVSVRRRAGSCRLLHGTFFFATLRSLSRRELINFFILA
ncbi:oskyddad [Carabus blaptoides fortunei]